MHTTYADLLGTRSNRPLLMPFQIAGAALDNYYAKKAAKKSREWQTEMSNTAYQRSMADMRAAGLNPILAYKQGGASTPSGGQATTPSFGAAMGGTAARGLQAFKMKSEIQNINANTTQATSAAKLNDRKASMLGPASAGMDTAYDFIKPFLDKIGTAMDVSRQGRPAYQSGEPYQIKIPYKRMKKAGTRAWKFMKKATGWEQAAPKKRKTRNG